VMAGLLQLLLPIRIMSDISVIGHIDPDWLMIVGLLIALAGLSLSLAGHRAMTRRGGYVSFSLSVTALVTDGVFARTRNPGYVGMLIALSGIAVAFGFDWLLILIVAVWALLHFVVVRHEEAYLEREFGRAYQQYKNSVPRYVFIPWVAKPKPPTSTP